MNHKENKTLYCLKGIGCIGVILIHFKFPGKFGIVISSIAQFAVPIFAITSGFFLNSYELSEQLILRKTKKILRITLIAIMFYFCYSSLFYLYKNEFGDFLFRFCNLKNILKILLINDFDIILGGHLWFLPGLLYVYLIIFIAFKLNRIEFLLKINEILIVFRLCVVMVSSTFMMNWHIRATWLTCILPYFILGMNLAVKKEEIQRVSLKKIIFGILFSLIWIILFNLMPLKINIIEIGVFCLAVFLFILSLNYQSLGGGIYIYRALLFSLYIYFAYCNWKCFFMDMYKGKYKYGYRRKYV